MGTDTTFVKVSLLDVLRFVSFLHIYKQQETAVVDTKQLEHDLWIDK